MTTYEPPSSNLAIFDPTVFETNNEPLTIEEAKKRFLTFPIAQGSETLLDTTIVGSLTINNNQNRINLSSSPNYSVVIGNNTTIPNGTPSFSMVMGTGTGQKKEGTIFGCVAIGSEAFRGVNASSNTEFYNTAVGASALRKVDNSDGSTISNTAIGYTSLSELLSGSNTTGIGVQSGVGNPSIPTTATLSGTLTTFLGAKTGLDPALGGIVYHSTAVGAEALITSNNQIQLGSASDYVNIPNYIKFPSGQNQNQSAFAVYNETTTLSSVSYTLSKYYNSSINFTSNQNTTITLPTPSVDAYLRIYNNCKFFATLNNTAGDFLGEYGNEDPTVRLNPNSWVLLYATNTTDWQIIDRSSDQTYDTITISNNTDYTTHFNLLNAYLPLSPNASTNRNVTIPNPTLTFSRNKWMKIANVNATNPLSLITPAGVFSGNYGSGTTDLTLPINSWVEIHSDGTNWLVNNRSKEFNLFLFANGTTINLTSNYQYLDNTVEFVQPDSPLITNTANFSGTATQSGYVLDVQSIIGGNIISAGSVITFNSRRVVIRGQVSGTLGGIGTYNTNVIQTVGTATAFTNGKAGTGTLTSGTVVISNTVTDNLGSGNFGVSTLNPCSTIGMFDPLVGGGISSNPFFIIEGNGSAGTRISTGALASINNPFYATLGTTVQLPLPSSTLGRTITLINSGNTPINITAGGALFGGIFGQILTTGVFPAYYILRASETVVLKSDGTIWESQTGTSLGGARSFVCTANNVLTSTAENTLSTITVWRYLDLNNSGLTGIVNNSGVFTNVYPFNITVNIAVVFAWIANSETATTTLPIKIGTIAPIGLNSFLKGNTTSIVNYQVVPCSLVSGNFPQGAQPTQTFNGIFTLRPNEPFVINFGKINGSAVAGKLGSATLYINRIS